MAPNFARPARSNDPRMQKLRLRLAAIHKLRQQRHLSIPLDHISISALDQTSKALFYTIASAELTSPYGLRTDLLRLVAAIQLSATSDWNCDATISMREEEPASPATPDTCDDDDDDASSKGEESDIAEPAVMRTPSFVAAAAICSIAASGATRS